MANKLFDWATIDISFLKKLIADPRLSAGDVVKRLVPRVDDRPTRSALLGFMARRSDLQEIWAKSRKRPVKTVAFVQHKPRIVAVGGVAVSPRAVEVGAVPATVDVVIRPPRVGRRVPLLDLKSDECKFPVEEHSAQETIGRHLFCGTPTLPGRPYCAHHNKIAFYPVRGRQPSTYVPQPKRTPLRLLKKRA